MLSLTLAPFVALCLQTAEIEMNNRNLELNLRVIEAFEYGPIIFDLSITNRGNKPLTVIKGSQDNSSVAAVAVPKSWHPSGWCGGTTGEGMLRPGETWTERHQFYLGRKELGPGLTHEFVASWPLKIWLESKKVGWRLIANPTKTFRVAITPATLANRLALVCRLRAEFTALPPDAEGSSFLDPLWKFCEKLSGAPRQEMIPLVLSVLDRAPLRSRFGGSNWFFRERMAYVVFVADPVAAHRIFVDRLIAIPPRTDPEDVFRIWKRSQTDFAEIGEGVVSKALAVQNWLDPQLWGFLLPNEEFMTLLYWANNSAARMLPDVELRRLATARDFHVRAWTYYVFGHRLGVEWSSDFLKEARQWIERKPDSKMPEPERSALKDLLIHLDPGLPYHRNLLDIFAAGAEDNPIAKAAHEKIAEYEMKKRGRDQ